MNHNPNNKRGGQLNEEEREIHLGSLLPAWNGRRRKHRVAQLQRPIDRLDWKSNQHRNSGALFDL